MVVAISGNLQKTYALAEELGLEVDWRPFTRDIGTPANKIGKHKYGRGSSLETWLIRKETSGNRCGGR